MNKLEKILAQSVTPEMVAEQLTEQEIEEVIEEYELKIESSKEFFDTAEQRAAEYEQKAILCQRFANDWKKTANEEKEKIKTWRSVVEKAKRALRETKEKSGIFRKGYMLLHDYNDAEKKSTPNKRRAELIDEAKKYITKNKYALEATVNRADNKVTVHDYGTTKKSYSYPENLVWNKYIVKAYGIAKYAMDHNLVNKYTFSAPQPTEIVEGMDIELLDKEGHFLLSGRVAKFNKTSDTIKLSKIYESMDSSFIKGLPIEGVAKYGYHISGDTKAKYGDGDE